MGQDYYQRLIIYIMSDPIADLFNDDSTKPTSNWFEFKVVGDSVGGELVEFFDKEGKYGMQRIYVVRKADGEEVNVSLKHTTHKMQVQQLKRAEPGDIVGFKFREEIDVGKGNKAKSIEVRIRHVENKEA